MYFWIVQGAHQKKMRKGKAAGQVAHAAARLARKMTEEQWEEYLKYEVKVVYKVRAPDELARLGFEFSKYPHTIVFDATWGMHTVFGVVHPIPIDPDGRFQLA
jgi:peptidyl-tRNA hydrolase